MNALNWIQFIFGIAFLILGLGIFFIQMIGIFKFKYVLNRMHAAAMGDTLGIGFSLIGLMILSGFSFTTLKMGLVIVFLWLASPVSSHLISLMELTTNEKPEEECRIPEGIREEILAASHMVKKKEEDK